MICLETSGGWVASLMSERIVMTGMRSRRFRKSELADLSAYIMSLGARESQE